MDKQKQLYGYKKYCDGIKKTMLCRISVLILFMFNLMNFCNACTCATKTFDEAIKSADEIFLGRIIKSELLGNSNNKGLRFVKVTFSVVEKWKGSDQLKLELLTGGSSCDYQFNNQKSEYLIFANNEFVGWRFEDVEQVRNFGNLTTNSCTRTRERNFYTNENFNDEILLLSQNFPDKIKFNKNNNNLIFKLLALIVIITIAILNLVKSRKKDYH